MPFYKYSAITGSGGNAEGMVEAHSLEAAQDQLAARGLMPTSVSETSGPDGGGGGAGLWTRLNNAMQKVRPQDLILFTKQLKTMLNAGIPVLQSLDVLQNQTENPKLRAAIANIAADIKSGGTLSRAFARSSPKVAVNSLQFGQ